MAFHSDQKLSAALKMFKRFYPDEYDVIREFSDDLLAEGLSELRIRTYVTWLKKIREVAGKLLLRS